ncbi:MAG: H-type lectin domain-containing protein, partial [Actinomycetota bacterium]|nr:H-type lectin domain-containing protein [Actinomycetota bacterium]
TGADIADGALSQADFPLAVVGPQAGLRIESGETTISTAALGIQTRTVGFDVNFSSPPLVLVSFSSLSNVGVSNLQGSSTTNDLTIKLMVENSSAGSYATVSWLAIGK